MFEALRSDKKEKKKKKKGKKERRKGHERESKSKKERDALSLGDIPAEVLVQIFDVVDDHFALWSLRCTCKSFYTIISSFPVLGNTAAVLYFIYIICAEWRAYKAKLMHEVTVNQDLESKIHLGAEKEKLLQRISSSKLKVRLQSLVFSKDCLILCLTTPNSLQI